MGPKVSLLFHMAAYSGAMPDKKIKAETYLKSLHMAASILSCCTTYFEQNKSRNPCQSSFSLVFFQASAALWLLFGWAGQYSFRAAFRKCSAVFSAFLGAHRPSGSRWVCVTSSRELRSTCFFVNGFIWVQTDNEAIGRSKHCFFNSRPDQCNRITGARRLYCNSCSAALICEFLCYAKNSLFCFRPFPETTFQERRRRRGAVLSKKKRKQKYVRFLIGKCF